MESPISLLKLSRLPFCISRTFPTSLPAPRALPSSPTSPAPGSFESSVHALITSQCTWGSATTHAVTHPCVKRFVIDYIAQATAFCGQQGEGEDKHSTANLTSRNRHRNHSPAIGNDPQYSNVTPYANIIISYHTSKIWIATPGDSSSIQTISWDKTIEEIRIIKSPEPAMILHKPMEHGDHTRKRPTLACLHSNDNVKIPLAHLHRSNPIRRRKDQGAQ